MTKWLLAAGAAALAISTPALADKGGHGAKGQAGPQIQNDRGGQKQAKQGRGGGHQEARANQGGGKAKQMRAVQGDHPGGGNKAARIETRGNAKAHFARIKDDHGRVNDKEIVKLGRGKDAIRARDHGQRAVDLNGDRIFKMRDVDRRGVVKVRDVDADELFGRRLGYGVGGCPPGLDKKNNGCMPPGQAAKFIGQPIASAARLAALNPLPRSLRNLYRDNDDYYYRYGGSYLYRVDRHDDLISGLIPLFGAALIGQPLQSNYINPYYQPSYFSSFYPNSPNDCYQYGYGYVYETDCMTGLVEDVIPTYDHGYGIGQIMPASYSYYNVPYAYRSYFADNDDYYYRYAPGAIYRVDRDTALVSAVAALLTGGLSVGQQLPMGYSAYNVPMAYRSNYYDTPDMWYRYDNGYIYSVDPTTRLVQAIVQAIV